MLEHVKKALARPLPSGKLTLSELAEVVRQGDADYRRQYDYLTGAPLILPASDIHRDKVSLNSNSKSTGGNHHRHRHHQRG